MGDSPRRSDDEVWRVFREPVGRATSLIDSADQFQMHLLLGEPRDERLNATFTKAQNISNKMPGKKEFILESEAQAFAEELAREIQSHPVKQVAD